MAPSVPGVRYLVVGAALLAAAAAADEKKNHYILDCDPDCRPAPAATATAIGAPYAVAADRAGRVYFSTQSIVFRLEADGTLSRIAGDGRPGFSGDGGPAIDARLNFPERYPERDADDLDFFPLVGPLALDGAGNLFIGDAYNNRVRRVDTDGIITTVGGVGDSGYPRAGNDVRFSWVQGLGFDAGGRLYVSSAWGILSRVDADGSVLELTTNNCGPRWPGPGLCGPEQIAVDGDGKVYVPDVYCRVRRVEIDGAVSTVVGAVRAEPDAANGLTWQCGSTADGAPATKTRLSNFPFGVAVDARGELYIADTFNHCVRRVDGNQIVTTVAGVCSSSGAFAGDGGRAAEARLFSPSGVAFDHRGNLYIADTGNGRVRKVDRRGIIATVAGNGAALPP